jgi:hypothetical protein
MNIATKLFHESVKTGAKILLTHESLNDEVEQARRYHVCNMNDGICFNKETDKCNHCGCYMSIKTGMKKHIDPKALGRITITHCPLAKWGNDAFLKKHTQTNEEIEIANYYRKLDNKELIS